MTIVVVAALVSAGSPAAAAPTADLGSLTDELDREQSGWMSATAVPGAAIAIIRDGKVAWVKGYGLADKARGVPVTEDTVFQVASISKPVTAWGVLRLVDKGLLDLDAPVDTYLTRWHVPPSAFDANGVTIRNLLRHSSGLTDQSIPGVPPDQPVLSPAEVLSSDTDGFGSPHVAVLPGTRELYSNAGYTVLQLVIEEVTGEDFSTYMQREVLDPLGMAHSGFEWRADLRSATATGYDTPGRPVPSYLLAEKAAAGLYTTASDLARFVAAGMTDPDGRPAGRGVLAPETFALMTALTTLPDQTTTTLGYGTYLLPDGTRLIGHGGMNRGWMGEFDMLADRREGVVTLTNSENGYGYRRLPRAAWMKWLGIGATPAIATPPPTPPYQPRTTLLVVGLLGFLSIAAAVYLVRRRKSDTTMGQPTSMTDRLTQ